MNPTSRIRLRHIRCFLEVADRGSVTKAAASLNTVQPALSRTLRELEAELGQTLFKRTAKGLILTQAGEVFRRHAQTGMSQIERGIQQVGGFAQAPAVSIGILPNVARTLIPAAIEKLHQVSPEVDVSLQSESSNELADKLRAGAIDFIVGRLLSLEMMPGLSFEHLYSEPLIFAACPGHTLAGQANLLLEEINRHPVVVPLPDTIIRRELDKFTTARGLAEFTTKIETVSFDFVRAYLSTGNAVACVPLGAVRQEIADGSLIDLGIRGEELVGSVGMSFAAGRELSAAAAELADAVRGAAQVYA